MFVEVYGHLGPEPPSRRGVALAVALWGTLVTAGGVGIGVRQVTRSAVLSEARASQGALARLEAEQRMIADSLARLTTESPATSEVPYIVVSADARRLWLRQGDSVLFEAAVATGKGDVRGSDAPFATPRRRFSVLQKETTPLWIPPDWHFKEYAAARGLQTVQLNPSAPLEVGGAVIKVDGRDVVRVSADGAVERFAPGREVVIGGRVVIPPFGTRQRSYRNVLGAYRLNMGEGYGIHGTDKPGSIGSAASHGCIRMRNEDISQLVQLVDVGTPVYIF